MIKQLPLSLGNAGKSDVRTQFAALCFRVKNGKTQILLITSRGSGRWILPKGWPIDGATPHEAALQEAWEEAGVTGKVSPRPLGIYSYVKESSDDDDLPCVAMIYTVKVKSLAKAFPEADQRKRKWVSPKKAAAMVDEPELSRILRDFNPRAVL
ncbi:MAG: NUDIX hydrolase [Pseudomonadota bacterium]